MISKTQYDVSVVRPDMQVQFIIKKGATPTTPKKQGVDSVKIMRTLTVFNDLVNIDKKETGSYSTDKTNEQYHLLQELQKVS